jgi:hypothetical protein
MEQKLKQYTGKMKLNSPATQDMLDQAAAELKMQFPGQYVEFMLESNGAEGPIGPSFYLTIWPADQLVTLNEEYAVNEFTPGLIYFGSDGGGMAYAFDGRGPSVIANEDFN